MDDRLSQMIALQQQLQQQLHQLPEDTPEARLDYFKLQILACTDELHEALSETGWKPWATSRHINVESAFGELRDAMQFLLNAMAVITGDDPGQLAHRLFITHQEKVKKNLNRQAIGYDGVNNKCPMCKRAYDDTGVTCRSEMFYNDSRPWCETYGYNKEETNA